MQGKTEMRATPIRGGLKRRFSLAAAFSLTALSLSACGTIPTPISVATYAVDGISYIVSGKSLTDHGISYVMGQDCALLRPFWGDPICKDQEGEEDSGTAVVDAGGVVGQETEDAFDPTVTLVAFNGHGGPVTRAPRLAPVDPVELATLDPLNAAGWAPVGSEGPASAGKLREDMPVEALADFATAAGATEDKTVQPPVIKQEAPKQIAAVPPVVRDPVVRDPVVRERGEPVRLEPVAEGSSVPRKPAMALVNALAGPGAMVVPDAGNPQVHDLVMVIGSFADPKRAHRRAKALAELEPVVLDADVNGQKRYRVALGPFPEHEKRLVRAIVTDAGIDDAWALRLHRESLDGIPARKKSWPAIGEALALLTAQ
ncbi:MAG: SPOR domain-containing protein [Magnetovibrionaceae bacterium]